MWPMMPWSYWEWAPEFEWFQQMLNSTVHKLRSVFDWQVEADSPATAMVDDGSEPDGKPPPPSGGKL